MSGSAGGGQQTLPFASAPIIEPDGRASRQFYNFLLSLYQRTGGSQALPNSIPNGIVPAIAALQSEQAVQTGEISDLQLGLLAAQPFVPKASDPLLPLLIAGH